MGVRSLLPDPQFQIAPFFFRSCFSRSGVIFFFILARRFQAMTSCFFGAIRTHFCSVQISCAVFAFCNAETLAMVTRAVCTKQCADPRRAANLLVFSGARGSPRGQKQTVVTPIYAGLVPFLAKCVSQYNCFLPF